MHDINRTDQSLADLEPLSLEAEFSRRVLSSERWRAQILCFVMVFLLLLDVLLPNLGQIGRLVQEQVGPIYQVGALLIVSAAIFEWSCAWICGWYLKGNKLPPIFLRYVNALIETSFPTMGLFIVAHMVGPAQALSSPVISAYYFFILLAALRLDFYICLFTGAVAASGYMALYAFPWGELGSRTGVVSDANLDIIVASLVRSIFLLCCGVLSGLVTRHIRQNLLNSMEVVAEKRKVVSIFSQLVSPQVANELLTRGEGAGSEVREVTILVVDIRNFTSFAEITPPDDLVKYLNIIWEAGVRVVHNHGGIINKFLGDGFMAVFGAPTPDERHAEKAVWAGLNLLGEMTSLQALTSIPETRLGIGIHSGPALLGIVGTADRREYTVIGDTVNVAFRIEQLNKEFDSQLLISEAVKRRAGEIAREAELLQHMFVRGRSGPVQAYRIV